MNQKKKLILYIPKFEKCRCVVTIIFFCATALSFVSCPDGAGLVLYWLVG
jgi:hypothetical protein